MSESILLALGLVLLIEGLLPLLAPARWRAAVAGIARLRDGQLRFLGLAAVTAGLLLILA